MTFNKYMYLILLTIVVLGFTGALIYYDQFNWVSGLILAVVTIVLFWLGITQINKTKS